MLGEEGGDDGTDVRWIVDPIDGTQNFVRGVPIWATLIALERDGERGRRRRLGAGAQPALVGEPGGGAFADGETIRVSGIVRLADASISVTSPRAMSRAGSSGSTWPSATAPGRAAGSAISGSTASSPKAPSTSCSSPS